MGAIKRNIPNFITCLNLTCGFVGIIIALKGIPLVAIYFLFAATFFDFIDGLIARLLKVTSPIGRDLDSLADVVTFGVLPGVLMFELMLLAMDRMNHFYSDPAPTWTNYADFILPLLVIFIPVFSAIRLARFNNDPEQSYSFKGLPTPANGIVMASVFYAIVSTDKSFEYFFLIGGINEGVVLEPKVYSNKSWLVELMLNPFILGIFILIMSTLLISPIKLMAFKFKGFGWKANQWKYILLILCLPLVIWLKFASAPIILILYILISQIHFRTQKDEIQS